MSERNQPKYHLFKNTRYALAGLVEVYKAETSFRVEVMLFFVLQMIVVFLPFSFYEKLAMSAVLFFPLVVEALNSAIERTVDLVTLEHHELAKHAKDAGSAAVFLSISTVVVIWLAIIIHNVI